MGRLCLPFISMEDISMHFIFMDAQGHTHGGGGLDPWPAGPQSPGWSLYCHFLLEGRVIAGSTYLTCLRPPCKGHTILLFLKWGSRSWETWTLVPWVSKPCPVPRAHPSHLPPLLEITHSQLSCPHAFLPSPYISPIALGCKKLLALILWSCLKYELIKELFFFPRDIHIIIDEELLNIESLWDLKRAYQTGRDIWGEDILGPVNRDLL